jgi:UDP-N-acetylglucosamine 2-epimerase (non-hydrolysing)
MKICSVVGTRPNFVKEFLINRELKRRGAHEILIHTGQHYDYEMSQTFFECFELPAPDYHLQVPNSGGDGLDFTGRAIQELAGVLRAEKPECVLSYGDVNSTIAAAIAATKLHIPFAHVEGGIRAVDRYNAEEINRRVSDVLADVIFCCTQTDTENLKKEGYEPGRIELSGDTMKDALQLTLQKNDITVSRGDYLVLTLHRQENLADETRLRAIFEGLVRSGRKIIFPAHPRSLQSMKSFGILEMIHNSRLEICKPMGYVEFLRLMAAADKILTDSGGVRREAYLLKKPCIVLIELSWFPEISQAGWKILTGPDPDRIADLIRNFEPAGPYQELFGDGMAHVKIVDGLMRRYAG